ncbi:CARDB domain-containing protein [Nostoc sp. C117]|uniref:CARDB domain-containing protein n=1 Tax=Nostoc sp. C117 TaxID=3349875 RepID=UPI00370DDC9D
MFDRSSELNSLNVATDKNLLIPNSLSNFDPFSSATTSQQLSAIAMLRPIDPPDPDPIPRVLSDLIIENPLAPSAAIAGNNIDITYTLKNQGRFRAAASSTNFYLSNDTTFSGDDILLGSQSVGPLVGGASSLQSASLNLGTNLAGNYYLLYQADAEDTVFETNENNNLAYQAIAITNNQPDLAIANPVAPTSAAAGDDIALTYTIQNQGNLIATPSTTKFYLSQDTNLNNSDIFLGSDAVNSLAAGASSSESATISLSSSLAPGTYYLFYQADGSSAIAESHESNNLAYRAINITPALPDLIIQNPLAPNKVTLGTTTTITYTLTNQGKAIAEVPPPEYIEPTIPGKPPKPLPRPVFATNFYLSKDTILSKDDIFLGSDTVQSLGAGASRSESASISWRANLPVGDYYLLYKADAKNAVPEKNETNNLAYRSIKVLGGDLTINNATAPTRAVRGDTINLTYTIKNQGNLTVDSSSTNFYLSKDTAFSNDDIFLGSDYLVNPLAAGASRAESASISLATNLIRGDYYLIYRSDGDEEIVESNENNNLAYQPIKIVGPDLRVQVLISSISCQSCTDTDFLFTDNHDEVYYFIEGVNGNGTPVAKRGPNNLEGADADIVSGNNYTAWDFNEGWHKNLNTVIYDQPLISGQTATLGFGFAESDNSNAAATLINTLVSGASSLAGNPIIGTVGSAVGKLISSFIPSNGDDSLGAFALQLNNYGGKVQVTDLRPLYYTTFDQTLDNTTGTFALHFRHDDGDYIVKFQVRGI